MTQLRPAPSPCPCGSAKTDDSCCLPYIQGVIRPATAEGLMRSRYTAYTRCDADYVLRTWHATTRPEILELQPEENPVWIGLEVKRHIPDRDRAIVEFEATYQVDETVCLLHEISRFVREDGQWYYVDGEVNPPIKRDSPLLD